MICKFCGTQLPDAAKFCAACGNSLVEAEPVEQYSAPTVEDQPTQYYSNPVDVVPEQQADVSAQQFTQPAEDYSAQQMNQPVAEAPAQYVDDVAANYSAYSVAAPSKKNMTPLYIGIACVVAVIGIMIAIFFTNKAGFLKTFMGKEDYAKSVLMNTITSVAADTSVLESATSSLSNAFATAAEGFDSEAEAALAMLAMANSSVGVDGISMSAGVDVRPSEDIYSGLEDLIDDLDLDIDADTLKLLVQKLNSYKFTAAEMTGEEAYQFAVSLGEDKSPLFNVTAYYGADGDVYITFPGATNSALLAEGEEIPEIEEGEAIALDMKQLAALAKQLEEVFDEYYKEAEVSVEKSSLKVEAAKFEGLCSEIIFEADTMHDMLSDMIDVLSDNDYLCDLLEDNIEDFDYDDDLISELEYSIEGLDEEDIEFCFRGYVTSSNKLAGIELLVYDKKNEMCISGLNTSANFAVGFVMETEHSTDVEMFLVAEKKDDKSGTAEFVVSDGGDVDVKMNIEYSDFGKHKAFGQETYVGTFKLLIDTDLIESIVGESVDDVEFEIGGEKFDLESVFDGAALVVKCSPSGSGLRYDVAFECEPLGYYGVYVAAEPVSKDIASGKFADDKVIELDDIAEDEGIEFVEQIAIYYAEKLLEDEVIGPVLDELGLDDTDDLIEGVTGGYDIDEYIERYYGDGDMAYAASTIMTHTW